METNSLIRLSAQMLEESAWGPSKTDRQYLAQEICYELFGLLGRYLYHCLLCSHLKIVVSASS